MPTKSLRLALGFLLFASIHCQYYPQLENRKGYLCIPGEPSSFPYVNYFAYLPEFTPFLLFASKNELLNVIVQPRKRLLLEG